MCLEVMCESGKIKMKATQNIKQTDIFCMELKSILFFLHIIYAGKHIAWCFSI